MESKDTYNIYKLYKEGLDDVMSRRREAERGGYKDPYEYHENPPPLQSRVEGSKRPGSQYSIEVERDGHRFVINLVKNGTPIDEYRARSSERPGEAKIAATKYFEQKHDISIDDGNEENAEDYNTFPGAPDVKMSWKQTPNQAKWSKLHSELRALANSNKPNKREEELEIIAQLQHIVDTDPKFENEYVSKPML
jgi:hypothetical protein